MVSSYAQKVSQIWNFADDILEFRRILGAAAPSITSTIRTKAFKTASATSSVKSSTTGTTAKSWIYQKFPKTYYSIES